MFALERQDGSLIGVVCYQANSVRREAPRWIMPAQDYERMTDKERWDWCKRRGYRVAKVEVLRWKRPRNTEGSK